jgi:hypothetical protein
MNKLIGVCCMLSMSALTAFAQIPSNWVDCSATLLAGKTQSGDFSSGISGVRCNRLNGDLYMNCIQNGLWKSPDKGLTWTRVDNNTLGGRCETGWGHNQDQNNPVRIAAFSLDGGAGYTVDGVTWKQFAGVGRNWDYGSVDWSSPAAQTIIAAQHESGGLVQASTNGGTSWKLLSIKTPASGIASNAMLGTMNASTFIWNNGTNGINRSTDLGNTWTQVSTINPCTRTPMYFNGKNYLGCETGLLVSTDEGATWQKKGASVSIYQGPFFGADENTMVIVGATGIYKTVDGAATWTKIANLKPNVNQAYTLSSYNYWATYSWDPVNNCVYATAMANHGFRLDLSGTSVLNGPSSERARPGLSIVNSSVRSETPFNAISLFSLSGRLLWQQRLPSSYSARIPMPAGLNRTPFIVRISTEQGFAEDLCR